jgi:biopolymer transport protein TolR
MAMSTGARGGFTSEPNLTPMIDVLLVLLIIFMVIVPTARKAIDVQLPDPNPSPVTATPNNDQIVLEVQKDGTYLINKQPVPPGAAGLSQMLHTTFDTRPEKIMFVKGDPAAKYQQVIQAMDLARGAGVKVIGITPKATQ